MLVYRIANMRYRDLTLSGTGAEKFGGRWNEVGTRAVYTSENVSLALLEYYVHSQNVANLPKDILVARIHIPDEFSIEEAGVLPAGWKQYPYTAATTAVFSSYAGSQDFFALRVPSAIVGVESNYILNPLFRRFGEVDILDFLELPVDHRLKGKQSNA